MAPQTVLCMARSAAAQLAVPSVARGPDTSMRSKHQAAQQQHQHQQSQMAVPKAGGLQALGSSAATAY